MITSVLLLAAKPPRHPTPAPIPNHLSGGYWVVLLLVILVAFGFGIFTGMSVPENLRAFFASSPQSQAQPRQPTLSDDEREWQRVDHAKELLARMAEVPHESDHWRQMCWYLAKAERPGYRRAVEAAMNDRGIPPGPRFMRRPDPPDGGSGDPEPPGGSAL